MNYYLALITQVSMLGVGYTLLAAALVGTASIFSKRGLERESFEIMLFISLSVSTPVFFAIVYLSTGFGTGPPEGLIYAALGGIVGSVVGRSLYLLGIEHVGPGKSLSINATSPLFATSLALVILNETVSVLLAAGTICVVIGVVFVARDAEVERRRAGSSRFVLLLPISGAALIAVAVTLRKLALNTGIAPIEAGAVNIFAGLAIAAPVVLFRRGHDIRSVDRVAMKNFVLASLLMTGSFVFYFLGLDRTPASVFFPLIQTQPLFAVGISALVVKDLEVITQWTALAAVIIVSGAALVVLG